MKKDNTQVRSQLINIIYISILVDIFFYDRYITAFIIFNVFFVLLLYLLRPTPKLKIPAGYDWEFDEVLEQIDTSPFQKSSLPKLEILTTSNTKVIYESETTIKEYADKIVSFFKDKGIEIIYVKHNKGPMLTQILFKDWSKTNGVKKAPIQISSLTKLIPDLKNKLGINVSLDSVVTGEADVIGISITNSKRDSNKLGLYNLLANDIYNNFVNGKRVGEVTNGLPITIGYTTSNQQLVYDLVDFPHLLIAGTTGSGKSVLVNTIISCLLFKLNPHELQMVMIDPKQLELWPYETIPHLWKPIITDVNRVLIVLNDLLQEHHTRLEKIKEAECKNIREYNEKKHTRKLPYIVTIIDELSEVLLGSTSEVTQLLIRLLQITRATGIHFILCTQRPSADLIDTSLKAQCSKIALRVESFHDSKTIIDISGAESLNGKGDGLIRKDGELTRFQSPFITTEETKKLIKEWGKLWNPSKT